MKTIEDVELTGKKVLCRVDFNVPLNGSEVTDDTRIRAALPTIDHLVSKDARVILMSHLGRPAGIGFEEEFSLKPVANYLASLTGYHVIYARDTIGEDAQEKVNSLENGDILILENLRFDKRETQNDPGFSQKLADLADLYVNDAFGTAHRAHASTAGVAELVPSYAGFLLAKEVETLNGMLENPQKPFVAIVGGSKVSDKVGVIDALIEKVDTLIIGGGMCFTFLLAQGYQVGTSLKEPEWTDRVLEMLAKAQEKGVSILLPTDIVAADSFSESAHTQIVSIDAIPDDMMGLDIGPVTAEDYAQAIGEAGTVFWNGPMGVFEMKPFEHGTKRVAQAVAENNEADTIIGGGDSVAAVNKYNMGDQMTFISTGGGASMELVQGKNLPGVESLVH